MESSAAIHERGFGKTLRRDRWWVPPLSVAIGLTICGGYATWAVLQGGNYFVAQHHYLSPFYSPCITNTCPEEIRFLGIGWWPLSPAILMMGIILGFRGTCYYYRKAYYRAYFMDPPACAVGEPWGEGYRGETVFPMVLQNLHRYFLYASIVVWLFLTYDTIMAFFPHGQFGMGLGSVILLVNLVLLSGYLFGCHSLRHLIGGNVDCYSCAFAGKARHGAWKRASWFNKRHMGFAWFSLVFVCLTDLYIRLVSMGTIADLRLF
ncbi:MAG: succinate dehydrogenase [Gemmatimonadota bacterium]|nr:succinate dehydrogenase [Gemmatimonadota bacterium]